MDRHASALPISVLLSVVLVFGACSDTEDSATKPDSSSADLTPISPIVPGGTIPGALPSSVIPSNQTVDGAPLVMEDAYLSGDIAPSAPMPKGYQEEAPTDNSTFEDYGFNEFVTDVSADRLSTFGLDVDTGSYTVMRAWLNDNRLPDKAGVRTEEYLNYFNANYPDDFEEAFKVTFEAAPSPFGQGLHMLRVGLQARGVKPSERKRANLVFLVDVSGSMSAANKLPLVQSSLKLLTEVMAEDDRIALVTYAGHTSVVLPSTSGDKKTEIKAAIDQLSSGGGTSMGSGMALAYEEAEKGFITGGINRVLVCSDGDANIGATSSEDILSTIEAKVDQGITMTTLGFGMGNYNDTMMEQLSNKGNGNYFYLDGEAEARRLFGERLFSTLQAVAKDAKLQVEFDPGVVKRYRLLGYENRDIADDDFRNDRVDAGEIGAGHSVTALYEVELVDGGSGALATARLRYKDLANKETVVEKSFPFQRDQVKTDLSAASTKFRFLLSVAEFAEHLRHHLYSEHDLDEILTLARANADEQDEREQEFLELIAKANTLEQGQQD